MYIPYTQKIITDPNMTEVTGSYEKIRTWKERLFTRPWKPWKKYKTVITRKPSTMVYTYHNYMVMHPETARVIRDLKNIT